jgi:hypothetical protein
VTARARDRYASEFHGYSHQLAYQMSNPSIMYKARLQVLPRPRRPARAPARSMGVVRASVREEGARASRMWPLRL